MARTKIEWATHTWSPVTGCTKISPGCAHCYAERMARRLAGRFGYPDAPNHFDVTLRPDRLDVPLKWRKPRTVFVCSMGDLFHQDVPTHYIAHVWNVMRQCPQHTFMILTKRPRPMLSILSDWGVVLPNIWLGVTAENQATADERIPLLLQTPAAVRFVSCEPLLGAIKISSYQFTAHNEGGLQPGGSYIVPSRRIGIDWVIAGGESGPGARPMHPDWARGIRDQCQATGVPFFMKQMSSRGPIPDDLMIRRFPDA